MIVPGNGDVKEGVGDLQPTVLLQNRQFLLDVLHELLKNVDMMQEGIHVNLLKHVKRMEPEENVKGETLESMICIVMSDEKVFTVELMDG